jgi:hypothetical protein
VPWAQVAKLIGKEAGLFVPSGTMSNAVALRTHTVPGDEIVVESSAHIYIYEGGGYAALCGASIALVPGERGLMTAAQVEKAIRKAEGSLGHSPDCSLVCVENTSNRGGGTCYDLAALDAIAAVAKKHGCATHMDGARLFHAVRARTPPTAPLALSSHGTTQKQRGPHNPSSPPPPLHPPRTPPAAPSAPRQRAREAGGSHWGVGRRALPRVRLGLDLSFQGPRRPCRVRPPPFGRRGTRGTKLRPGRKRRGKRAARLGGPDAGAGAGGRSRRAQIGAGGLRGVHQAGASAFDQRFDQRFDQHNCLSLVRAAPGVQRAHTPAQRGCARAR